MNKTKLVYLLGIIVIVLLGSLFILNQKGKVEIEDQENIELTGEVKEFDIIAKNREFVPNVIKVDLGERIILNVKSIDVTHGLFLPLFGVNEILEPNKEIRVEFIANKTGEFSFFCNVFCGKGNSEMEGRLIVN